MHNARLDSRTHQPTQTHSSGSGDDQEPRDVAAGGDTPPTPSSSPPLPRGMLPPPVVTVKRGVSIGGAHTVSMGYKVRVYVWVGW